MFGFSFNHSSIAEQKMVGGALNSRKRRGPMLPANAQVCVRRISASISIIDLQGKVTALAEHALLDAYTQANSPTTSIVMVNFSRLEYMNSAGIGLMVTLLSRVTSQKQRLLTFGLGEHYLYLFRLTRLDDDIALYHTEIEALAAAQAAEACGHLPAKERGGR
jgi:anti-sigma B factor antagonist